MAVDTKAPERIGCGDHSCVIAPPRGMGTNGGCRCDARKLRREVLRLQKRYEEAMEALAATRGMLAWCAEQSWDGCNIDGGDFQDEMVKRGLMQEAPASEEFRAEYECDFMYVLSWSEPPNDEGQRHQEGV